MLGLAHALTSSRSFISCYLLYTLKLMYVSLCGTWWAHGRQFWCASCHLGLPMHAFNELYSFIVIIIQIVLTCSIFFFIVLSISYFMAPLHILYFKYYDMQHACWDSEYGRQQLELQVCWSLTLFFGAGAVCAKWCNSSYNHDNNTEGNDGK